MTKEQERKYETTKEPKAANEELRGRKFKLDCGHHVTFNHNLANDITIRNGSELKIICSLCGY